MTRPLQLLFIVALTLAAVPSLAASYRYWFPDQASASAACSAAVASENDVGSGGCYSWIKGVNVGAPPNISGDFDAVFYFSCSGTSPNRTCVSSSTLSDVYWFLVHDDGVCPEGESPNPSTGECEEPPLSCPPPLEGTPPNCECPLGTVEQNGQCVDNSLDNCVSAIQNSGGNGKVSVSESGEVSCSIGIPSPGSCTGTFADEACFSEPDGETCSSGAYGTVNGNPVCVGSAASDQAGSSSPSSWGETTGDAQVVSENTTISNGTNAAGQSTTTTTTTSTTSTETTNTQPDVTAAPYTCEDGRLAADRPSCDSAVTCDAGFYLVYGSCIGLPTTSETETTESEETTTTTVNNETGEQTTETTESNTTRPGGGGGGTVKVEIEGLGGPCDPSDPSYLECVASPSSMPAHTDLGGETVETGFQAAFSRIEGSPLGQSFNGVATVIPTGEGNCPPFAVDLSDTIIGRNISTTVHCDLAETIRPILFPIMLIVFSIFGFRILASA